MPNNTRTFQSPMTTSGGKPRLLLVEDELAAAKAYVRVLAETYDVTHAVDGIAATTLLQQHSYDIILTDVVMPGISGVELLRLIRTYDLEVPVLLMTAAPELAGAIHAVDLGALGYLIKPFTLDDLEKRLAKGLALSRLARTKREALEVQPPVTPLAGVHTVIDRSGLSVLLDRALSELFLLFQPIVSVTERRIVAYETLMRSREPAMASPGAILEAAEKLFMVPEVTARVNELAAAAMSLLPEGASLFVNIHANDLKNDDLTRHSPLLPHARRVVLEITERGEIDAITQLAERIRVLRQAGYRIAIDDLGAGYAGLNTFASVEPEIVKVDMALIRGIDASIVRQRIVSSLVSLSRELSMTVVAEGIETPQELACVAALGCDLVQGYLLGRPTEMFVATFTPW